MADVDIEVNGKRYAGWTSVRVTRGIESVSGSFDLTVSDRWGSAGGWPIAEGDACTVRVAGQPVVTGFVDKRSVSLSATEHSVSVSGRDATGNLVDSSCVLKKWEFRNIPILALARELAKPFNVPVTLQAGLKLPPPPARLAVDPGDTVFDVIDRACRTAALLAMSDGKGGLLLTRPTTGRASTEVVEGENLLAGSVERDATDRFHRVVVRGQSSGTDLLSGTKAAAIEAAAVDENEPRTARVLLVRPEGNMTSALAKKRAEWETAVRAARSVTVTAVVQGWTQGNGTLWPVNSLVHVKAPTLGVDGDFLLTQAVYSLDGSSGSTTELTLRPPDAFTPEPVIQKKAKKNSDPLAGL